MIENKEPGARNVETRATSESAAIFELQRSLNGMLNWFLDIRSIHVDREGRHRAPEIAGAVAAMAATLRTYLKPTGVLISKSPTLFEPATSFKIGYPADFGLGVDTKFQQKFRIWVDRTPDRIFVIYARCTHLGCTPDWKPAENKFKCPCHGSGYDSEGINFEGPAPRPMDRAKVEIAPDGQILVDVSKLYQWPKGQPTHFNDPGAFLPT